MAARKVGDKDFQEVILVDNKGDEVVPPIPNWESLVTLPQPLTGAFETIGSRIATQLKAWYLRVPFKLDGNNSRNIQIRVVYETTPGGTKDIPYDPNKWSLRASTLDNATQTIRTLNGSVSAELNGWFSVEIEIDEAPPYDVKVQVKAGTVGATAGRITEAHFKGGLR